MIPIIVKIILWLLLGATTFYIYVWECAKDNTASKKPAAPYLLLCLTLWWAVWVIALFNLFASAISRHANARYQRRIKQQEDAVAKEPSLLPEIFDDKTAWTDEHYYIQTHVPGITIRVRA